MTEKHDPMINLTDPDVLEAMTHDQLKLRVEMLEGALDNAQFELEQVREDDGQFERDKTQLAYWRELLKPLISESINQPGNPVEIQDRFRQWVSERMAEKTKAGKPKFTGRARDVLAAAVAQLESIIRGTA